MFVASQNVRMWKLITLLALAISCYAAPRPTATPATTTPAWDCKFDGSEFMCDAKCIPAEWRCDGKLHCEDGRDELDCDPEELGNKFEGDMVIEENQNPFINNRNGVVDPKRIWPNGEFPYEITGNFSTGQLAILDNAFEEYHAKTCIKFVRKTAAHTNWVQFDNQNRRACYSNVGRNSKPGPQTLNYGDWCFKRFGTMLHEIAHSLGFYHEQSRFDRDHYVVIMWKKIVERYRNNFFKYTDKDVQHLGAPYDYGSMMHYGPKGFSVDGTPTIIPLLNVTIGQRDGFSPSDLFKINKLYECDKQGISVTLPPDVTWASTPLPTIAIPSPAPIRINDTSYTCNFDGDMCFFFSDWLRPLEWLRYHGETPSPGTGPLGDHTTGYGFYMYTEASSSKQGTTSRMFSPVFTKAGDYCFSFWYHMKGFSMGGINVYTKTADSEKMIYNQTGKHGMEWHKAQRFVTLSEPTQFTFEGVIGSGFSSDMAIDDFSLVATTAAECSDIDKMTPTPAPTTEIPDGTTFLTCSFDSDTCKFLTEGDFKWQRHQGPTSSPTTGPPHDVSKLLGRPEGSYMYTEASWNAKKTGRIAGPLGPKVLTSCVDFWYSMYGQDMGRLNVGVRYNNTNVDKSIFSIAGNQGEDWHHKRITVPLTTKTSFQLVFEARVGPNFWSDMAVDQITITTGRC